MLLLIRLKKTLLQQLFLPPKPQLLLMVLALSKWGLHPNCSPHCATCHLPNPLLYKFEPSLWLCKTTPTNPPTICWSPVKLAAVRQQLFCYLSCTPCCNNKSKQKRPRTKLGLTKCPKLWQMVKKLPKSHAAKTPQIHVTSNPPTQVL